MHKGTPYRCCTGAAVPSPGDLSALSLSKGEGARSCPGPVESTVGGVAPSAIAPSGRVLVSPFPASALSLATSARRATNSAWGRVRGRGRVTVTVTVTTGVTVTVTVGARAKARATYIGGSVGA